MADSEVIGDMTANSQHLEAQVTQEVATTHAAMPCKEELALREVMRSQCLHNTEMALRAAHETIDDKDEMIAGLDRRIREFETSASEEIALRDLLECQSQSLDETAMALCDARQANDDKDEMIAHLHRRIRELETAARESTQKTSSPAKPKKRAKRTRPSRDVPTRRSLRIIERKKRDLEDRLLAVWKAQIEDRAESEEDIFAGYSAPDSSSESSNSDRHECNGDLDSKSSDSRPACIHENLSYCMMC